MHTCMNFCSAADTIYLKLSCHNKHLLFTNKLCIRRAMVLAWKHVLGSHHIANTCIVLPLVRVSKLAAQCSTSIRFSYTRAASAAMLDGVRVELVGRKTRFEFEWNSLTLHRLSRPFVNTYFTDAQSVTQTLIVSDIRLKFCIHPKNFKH